MVTELEVDALDRAFKTIDYDLQKHVGEMFTPVTLASIAAEAQTSLFAAGMREGFDWRCIHFKARELSQYALRLEPVGLDERGEGLLNAVFDRYARSKA